jgi:hypothetical protein
VRVDVVRVHGEWGWGSVFEIRQRAEVRRRNDLRRLRSNVAFVPP